MDEEVEEVQHHDRKDENKKESTQLVINKAVQEKKAGKKAPESERKYEVSLEDSKTEQADRNIKCSEDVSVDAIISTEASLSARRVGEMNEDGDTEIAIHSKLVVEEPIIATSLEREVPLQDALQELPPVDEDAIVLAYESRLQEEIIRHDQLVQEEPIVQERREDVF